MGFDGGYLLRGLFSFDEHIHDIARDVRAQGQSLHVIPVPTRREANN